MISLNLATKPSEQLGGTLKFALRPMAEWTDLVNLVLLQTGLAAAADNFSGPRKVTMKLNFTIYFNAIRAMRLFKMRQEANWSFPFIDSEGPASSDDHLRGL